MLILATTLLLSLSVSAQAQTVGHQLRGMSQFYILTEVLKPASAQCGLTQEGIRAAILHPASSAKFQIVDHYSPTVLYVNLATLYLASIDSCVTNVLMELRSYQRVIFEASDHRTISAIELWFDGNILGSARREHQQAVTQAIEALTKVLVMDWNLDNK